MLDTFNIPFEGSFVKKRVHVWRNRKAPSFSSKQFSLCEEGLVQKEVPQKSDDWYDHKIFITKLPSLFGEYGKRDPDYFLSSTTQ